MRFFSIFFILLSTVVVTSCCTKQVKHDRVGGLRFVEVSWGDYDSYRMDDPNYAYFTVNGVNVGRGRAGLQNVLNIMETMNEGTVVRFDKDIGDWSGGLPRYVPPFDALDMFDEIVAVADRKLLWLVVMFPEGATGYAYYHPSGSKNANNGK